ncbi:hypothetical protein OG215_37815 (plasmid) [Streptomyces globisporus]|uniref:hypothetical protein n=1 Tax=Streptomyces globisporus TaxID=1908 RepID=UPI002F90D10B|nr:hypothetical protein OG215_37815 [Streptomyces globisporus]
MLNTLLEWDPDADPNDKGTEFDWSDIDGLLGMAHNAGVSWAQPLAIWPLNAHEALITLDLPDAGPRLCSLVEEVAFYRPPLPEPTVADAVWHALTAVRDTGAGLVAELERAYSSSQGLSSP